MVFQNSGRTPCYICLTHIWTTHEEHLVVSNTVLNLDLYQICHNCRGCRHNHLWQIFWWLTGADSVWIKNWQYYHAACDQDKSQKISENRPPIHHMTWVLNEYTVHLTVLWWLTRNAATTDCKSMRLLAQNRQWLTSMLSEYQKNSPQLKHQQSNSGVSNSSEHVGRSGR